jgi:hypothetical protein
LVQGAWGNGKIGQGELRLVFENPDQELTPSNLSAALAGAILVSENCSDPQVLSAAAQLPVNGLVLASMSPALVSMAVKMDFPILLVEGFGKHPLNPIARDILFRSAGQLTALNSEPADLLAGTKPELFIPRLLQEPGRKSTALELFAPGKPVRLINLSHLGQVGFIVDLLGDSQLPNGLTASAARIRLDNGEIVDFPLANLEILV